MKIKSIIHSCCISLAIASLTLPAVCSAAFREVVFLKNGSVIKGDIIEQVPDQSLKMRTSDGSIFVYKMEEVEKIAKEEISPPIQQVATATDVAAPEPARTPSLVTGGGGVSLWTALSVPFGEYGKGSADDDYFRSSSAFAEQGFAGGLQFSVPTFGGSGLLWATDISFIRNSFDKSPFESDKYSTFTPPDYKNISTLTGLMIQFGLSQALTVYGLGQAGINFLLPSSAEYIYHDPAYPSDDEDSNIEVGGATSFAFALGTGIRVDRRFLIGFKYMNMGEPEIDVSVKTKSGSTSKPNNVKKSISMGLITLGIAF